ncbi:MAG: hypothetical protein ABI647_26270 [Gemmatimonadota bacterium]
MFADARTSPSAQRGTIDCPVAAATQVFMLIARGGQVTPTTREQVMEVIRNLPAETSVEEAMERLYFLADIEEGLRQVEHGEVISHEEAKRRLLGRS